MSKRKPLHAYTDMTPVTARIPTWLRTKILKIAKSEGKSESYHMREAMAEYVEKLDHANVG